MLRRPPVRILLVDDSEADVLLTREAFEATGTPIEMQVAQDGVEALAYLRREGVYAQAPQPDVILLDIHMPRKNGLEVLHEVKADAQLRRIPVVMLTTSQAESDIARSYAAQASSYIVKPAAFDQFQRAILAFEAYWLSYARFPPHK